MPLINAPSERALRRRMTEEDRKKAYENRDEKFRMRQQLYEQFRDALNLMAGLPRAVDVVAIVRARDRNGIVTNRLPGVFQWMKDFQEAWDANEKI